MKSVLQPPKEEDGKMPTMLKKDQPVTVLANTLDYDSTASRSDHKGGARLFQGDTSIKADEIVLDDKKGDLSGRAGHDHDDARANRPERQKDRVRSIGAAKDFSYEDATRRLTYTGDAHA